MKELSNYATMEPTFLIDYCNGYTLPTDAKDLQQAIEEATEQFAYTQQNVIIKDYQTQKPVVVSRWYSVEPDESIGDEPLEIIGSGWYDRFVDYETGEYI